MLGFEALEKLPRRPEFPLFRVVQSLPDALLGVGTGGDVKQALIRFGILHNGRCLPSHRKHDGAFGFLELFHEVAGLAAEMW